MSDSDFRPIGANGGMTARVRRILLEPKREWPAIDAEPMTVKGIVTGWAVPLAAIGPVAQLIGGQVFGYGAFGIVFRPPLMGALISAVIGYAMALLMVWVLSLVIDALAPTFHGVKNPVAAMKVAAYSMTASWLAGVFGIIPMLGFLALLGLYGLYLLYLGLPRLMRSPEDKALPYTVVTVLAAIVLTVAAVAVTSAIAGIAMRASAPTIAGQAGTITVPGGGTVDLGRMNAAAAQMAAAGSQMAAAGDKMAAANPGGAPAAVAPAALAALLPPSIGGWQRSEIESASGAAGGLGGSSATARYTQGSDALTLEVTDLGVAGALASLGSALNVQSSKQTATGYERTGTVDGRLTSAKWDSASHEGEYSIVVANRFSIKAEGRATDDAQFKSAVDAVDMGKLAALAAR